MNLRIAPVLVLLSSCVLAVGQDEEHDQLLAFVGERISFKKLPTLEDEFLRPHRYKATYRVIRVLEGKFGGETVGFFGSHHSPGSPGFEEFRYALLFVHRIGEKYVDRGGHSWSAVYRTKSGRWAGPYHPFDHWNYQELAKPPSIKPERIDFPEEATETLDDSELESFRREFWEPYWKLVGNRLIPIQGNYVEELLELKKIVWIDEGGLR